jgi:cobalt-zinc-cadmium efflux system outer membrane protein
VLIAVRLGYFQVLTSQETTAKLRELARIAAENVETSTRLRNIGQADETEVLQAEIESQRAELAIVREQTRLGHLWTALAAVVGVPDLPLTALEGKLDENLPDFNEQALLNSLLNESPAVKIAEANIARAEAQLARERRQAVPDLQLRGGLQQNRELLEPPQQSVGLQGFAEIGVQIPIFNRNQGSVQAARAARERAEQERARVQLVLRERAASTIQGYTDARARVDRYRDEILPRAQRAYELMLSRWGQMAASYPQVLTAQRTLFQSEMDYVAALGDLRESALTLEGFFLVDGLEAPARPGEVDLPVRETNIPTPRGIPGGRD